jgi:C4-dicarboxylate-specific signal transduction histidine kinase
VASILFVATAIYATFEFTTSLRKSNADAASAAAIIASNIKVALYFEDKNVAQEALNSLTDAPDIDRVRLFLADGSYFVGFNDPEAAQKPTLAETAKEMDSFDLRGRARRLITVDGETAGTVEVIFNHQPVINELASTAVMLIATLVLSVGLGLMLARHLQIKISAPVLSLARTAAQVTRSRDFGLRAVRSSNDEIGDLAETFNQMLDEIQRRDREKDEMQAQVLQAGKLAALGTIGAGVAHELNNPLTAIRGFCELTANRVDQDTKQGQQIAGYMTRVLAQVERMREIIDHIRVFSRNDNQTKRANASIEKLVNDTLILLRGPLRSANIQLDLKFEPNLPEIQVNAINMESVLQNLIVNARDAFETSNSNSPRKIIISARTIANKTMVISVEDNAGGMPEAVRLRIFDPFFTTKEVGRGTGLGLSLVHGIIKNHGGRIEVMSEEGKGSRFDIYLPTLQARALKIAS